MAHPLPNTTCAAMPQTSQHVPPTTPCHAMLPTGNCTYQAVNEVNKAVYPVLQALVQTPFFRYFKVSHG